MSEPKQKQVQEQNQAAKAQQVETQQVEQVQTAVSTYPAVQRALADPDGITPNDAKILQRTFGNQAVRRFVLQRKMTVGPVGDKYEQEADAVAKQVVQTINTPTSPPVRRQGEDDELQMKPSSSAMPSPSISTLQRHTLQREWKPARPNLPPFPFLQRQEEDELQAKGDSMLTGGELSGDLESSVQQAKSGGQPLGDGVRGSMEQAFNADFSGVKVHTDTQSDTLNRSISARAFTTGSDIFFRGGEYNPASSAGKTLIAHELTHTIQQGASPALRGQGKQASDRAAVQRQEEEDELAQMKPSLQRQKDEGLEMKRTDGIQRQEEDEMDMSRLNRAAAPAGTPMLDGGEVNADIETGIRGAKGGGSPLADTVRKPMEGAFNADFSGVKVHTDNQSDALNQSVSAKAFTTGNDIFFRSGAYEPGTESGKELIAHELTHTVQQGAAPVLRSPDGSESAESIPNASQRSLTAIQRHIEQLGIQVKASTSSKDVFFRQELHAQRHPHPDEVKHDWMGGSASHIHNADKILYQGREATETEHNLTKYGGQIASTGEATDIVSSGADVVTGLSGGLKAADAIGDFTGDIATAPENISNVVGGMAKLGKAGLLSDPRAAVQKEPLATVETVAGLAALTSSLDTFGSMLSYVVDTSTIVSIGSYVSEWNPVIGAVGSSAKVARSEQDRQKFSAIGQTMNDLASSSPQLSVKEAAKKLAEAAGGKAYDSMWGIGLNIVDTASNLLGPLGKGVTQVATKSAGSSWGDWMVRKIAHSNSYTAGYMNSYEVAKAAADAEAATFQTELLALAGTVVTAGDIADIKALYEAADELELGYFTKAIKDAGTALVATDPKKVEIAGL